jgi:hypothetical protein
MVLDSLSGADRAQLHELYARSVILLELGRCDQWADLFEPGAIFQCTCAEEQSATEHRFEGKVELTQLGEWIARGEFDVALGKVGRATRSRHLLTDICLFEDGSHHVAGYAHVTVIGVGCRAPHYLTSGLYVDRISKCGSGCWRFAKRRFRPDINSGESPTTRADNRT